MDRNRYKNSHFVLISVHFGTILVLFSWPVLAKKVATLARYLAIFAFFAIFRHGRFCKKCPNGQKTGQMARNENKKWPQFLPTFYASHREYSRQSSQIRPDQEVCKRRYSSFFSSSVISSDPGNCSIHLQNACHSSSLWSFLVA